MKLSETAKKALVEFIRAVAMAAIAFLTAVFVPSCGTTRAVITNRADNTSTEVKISTNNPTTVNVNPSTTVDFTPKSK